MHEASLMRGLVTKLDELARAEGARRITRVRVRLGALSHFSPEHFREHFEAAVRGGPAEGATLEITAASDPAAPGAQDVELESIDVEEA